MASVEWTRAQHGTPAGRVRGAGQAATRRAGGGQRVRTVAHWIVVGGALGYLAWSVPGMVAEVAGAGARVDHVQWMQLTAAALCGVGAVVAYGELTRQLLVVGGVRVPVTTMQGINFAQNAVSATVPVVGGPGSFGYAINQLRRRGVDSAVAAWAVLMTAMITTVTLLVLTCLGLAWTGRVPPLVAVPAAVVVALGAAGVWLLLTHPTVLRRGLPLVLRLGHRTPGVCDGCRRTWADRADSVARRVSDQVASLRPSGPRWMVLIGVALAGWALDFLTLVASAAATDVQVSVTVLVLGFLVVQGAIALQILPGGAGLADAGLLGILLASGVPAASAAVTVLIYRIISWLGPSVVGWVVYALQPHGTPAHSHEAHLPEPAPVAYPLPASHASSAPV